MALSIQLERLITASADYPQIPKTGGDEGDDDDGLLPSDWAWD